MNHDDVGFGGVFRERDFDFQILLLGVLDTGLEVWAQADYDARRAESRRFSAWRVSWEP